LWVIFATQFSGSRLRILNTSRLAAYRKRNTKKIKVVDECSCVAYKNKISLRDFCEGIEVVRKYEFSFQV
jgi:hypothetical protein